MKVLGLFTDTMYVKNLKANNKVIVYITLSVAYYKIKTFNTNYISKKNIIFFSSLPMFGFNIIDNLFDN